MQPQSPGIGSPIRTASDVWRRGMAAKKQGGQGAQCRGGGASPYVQRVIEDAELRENIRVALENAREAYGRLTNGKPATKILDDKKLHKERQAGGRVAARRRPGPARGSQEEEAQAARLRQAAARRHRRRRRGARPERGPAQQGPRHAVRRRGGVRLHVDHVARSGRRDGVLRLLARLRSDVREGAPGAPSFVPGRRTSVVPVGGDGPTFDRSRVATGDLGWPAS